MIPKKIHYFWMGSSEMPEKLQKCVDSWRTLMPDYEIIRWDDERVAPIDSLFLRQAIEEKKWAFASDYVRLYALYHEGGIYLDTDVMAFRRFDDLLHLKAFTGAESTCHVSRFFTPRCITSFCMGSEPGHQFFKEALAYYDGRPFVRSRQEWLPEELRYETTVNTYILMQLARMHGYNPGKGAKFPQQLDCELTIFDPETFNPQTPGKRSYIEHRAEGSWREDKLGSDVAEGRRGLKRRLRNGVMNLIDKAGWVLIKKK